MTRDFLIEFHNEDLANKAQDVLSSIKVDNQDLLFKEIDNRGKDLFVTLSYLKKLLIILKLILVVKVLI